MAADLYLDWGGDLDWSASGDLLVAEDTVLANQRLVRRWFTNPEERQANGDVTEPGDYLTEPTYGEGLGKVVDQLDTPARRAEIVGKIRSGLQKEVTIVDQSIPPTINFFDNRENGLLGVTVDYTLLSGSRARAAFEL